MKSEPSSSFNHWFDLDRESSNQFSIGRSYAPRVLMGLTNCTRNAYLNANVVAADGLQHVDPIHMELERYIGGWMLGLQRLLLVIERALHQKDVPTPAVCLLNNKHSRHSSLSGNE